jgi:hypothetical protein
MADKKAWLQPGVLLAAGCLLTGLLYLPGLSGPWLLDDFNNIGLLLAQTPDSTPYREIIFSNPSGPLGRPVAMATFAANHALGLFSTPALKATNVALHLLTGVLVFLLLRLLFARRQPVTKMNAGLFAALLGVWWLLLPLHMSTVLYIVQRMTELSSIFALGSCITYVHGRDLLAEQPRRGWLMLTTSLLLLFPLALLAKESAACTLAWLALIELFFFHEAQRQRWLGLALIGTGLLLGFAVLLPPAVLEAGYGARDFSMGERLLSQPRALWSYIQAILLPEAAGKLGIFQDDFPVSRSLLAPWTTLPALVGLLGLLFAAWRLAASPRWWPVSFGLLFFLAGHIVESTVVPLELYFEHRNYLPSLGLLLAAGTAVLAAWPWSPRLLAMLSGLFLALIALSTSQRSMIWGNEALLLEVSARNHPHSLRANDVHVENLLGRGEVDAALASSEQFARENPEYALPSLLHMISIYCRVDQAVPVSLIQAAAQNPAFTTSTPEILALNLANILKHRNRENCRSADFSSLGPVLLEWDGRAFLRYGVSSAYPWEQRMELAEWLAATGAQTQAVALLQDLWSQYDRAGTPQTGILLTLLLRERGDFARMHAVLAELAAATTDAPAPVRNTVALLQQETADLPRQ